MAWMFFFGDSSNMYILHNLPTANPGKDKGSHCIMRLEGTQWFIHAGDSSKKKRPGREMAFLWES